MNLVVLGMHRSGTSPLTRVLSLLGAEAGPREDLVAPAPDNPRGFWENRTLLELNERLLALFDGTSWSPPRLAEGWTRNPGVVDLRAEALEAVKVAFGGAALSVWKDPRTSLTFDFWKEILRPCTAVVAVRNPLEIAESIEARDGIPADVGMCLWEIYTRSLLGSSAGVPRVGVRYDALLADPMKESERLRERLQALGVEGLSPAPVEELRAFVDPSLRHAVHDLDDVMSDPRATASQAELFRRMLALAEGQDADPLPPEESLPRRTLELHRSHLRRLEVEQERLARDRERLQLHRRNAELHEDHQLQTRALDDLRAETSRLRADLDNIVGSKAWAVARALQGVRRRSADWVKRGRTRQRLLRPAVRLWHVLADLHQRREIRRQAPAALRHVGAPRDEAIAWFRTRRTPASGDARARILHRPLVNVIVTTHDDAIYLPDLLASLREQTLQRFHLTLVDDASTDPESVSILDAMERTESREVAFLRLSENVGLAAARNRGIEATDPEVPYLACVDADDILHPAFLARTVDLLERNPDLGTAYFDYQHFGAAHDLVRAPEYDLPALLRENFMVACSPFRRALWQQAGGYDEGMRGGYEDWELWIRLAKAGWYGRRIPEPLLYYRRREGSLVQKAWASGPELVDYIQKKHPDLYAPERLAEIESVWSAPPEAPRVRRGDPTRSRPKVTVVIPCYNQGVLVEQTVESVRAQTYPEIEILVVDDGSTDEETVEACRRLESPGVRVLRQRNAGLASARNFGIEAARGEFVLPLDSDDVILPQLVERLVDALRRDRSAGFAYPDIVFFGDEAGVHAQEEFSPALELTNNHVTVCALFRKSDWRIAGGYNPNMKQGMEDWDFWVSLVERGRFGRLVPEPLFGYRVRAGSMSQRMLPHVPDLVSRLRANHERLFRPEVVRKLREAHPPVTTAARRYPASGHDASIAPAPGRISVVVPVYRHERFLPACLDSVLSQDDGDFELVIVDDCSGTPEVDRILEEATRDPRCRVLRNPENRGISRTLNRGIAAARGTHVALLDCDDELVPGALKAVRSRLTEQPAWYLSSRIADIDEAGRVLGERARTETPADLLRGNFAGHLKVVAREVFDTLGPFDPAVDGCQDYDLALRCAERYPLRFVSDVLYRYRWHGGTVSVAHELDQELMAERVRRRARLRRFLADGRIRKGALFGLEFVLLGDRAEAPPPLPDFDVRVSRLGEDWAGASDDLGDLPRERLAELVEIGAAEGPPFVVLVGAGARLSAREIVYRLSRLAEEPSRRIVSPVRGRSALALGAPDALPAAGAVVERDVLRELGSPEGFRVLLESAGLAVTPWAPGNAPAPEERSVRPAV